MKAMPGVVARTVREYRALESSWNLEEDKVKVVKELSCFLSLLVCSSSKKLLQGYIWRT